MDVLIGVVTSSEVGKNRGGEVAGRLLQAAISEPTDVQTVEMVQGGDEFHPPPGIRLILVDAGDCLMAVGTDDGIPPAMEPGGRRIYSLDPTGMQIMAEVQLKPDGTVWLGNSKGGATLSPSGAWTFHGVSSTFDHPVTMQKTLDVQEAVTSAVSVTAPSVVGSTDVTFAGKSAAGHKHITTGVAQFTSVPA